MRVRAVAASLVLVSLVFAVTDVRAGRLISTTEEDTRALHAHQSDTDADLDSSIETEDGETVPGIELAARQSLFNYATQQGLEILKGKIQTLAIPDVSKSFNVSVCAHAVS